MSLLSAIVATAIVIAALVALHFLLRQSRDEIWEWSDEAYRPEPVRDPEARAVTRIKSRDIYWEIKP